MSFFVRNGTVITMRNVTWHLQEEKILIAPVLAFGWMPWL
jgi:hypothetical protein